MHIVALVSLVAGMIIGAAVVSYRFRRNWQSQNQQAEDSLQKAQEQEKALRDENESLKQALADAQYTLNETKKELNHLKNTQA